MKKYIFLFLVFKFLILLSFELKSAWVQTQNITPRSYVGRTYLDIMFLKDKPNFGWASGFQGTILRTTDTGKSWVGQELIPGVDIQLESITFLNERVGYVSGPVLSPFYNSAAVIFKSTDGGLSWFDVTPDRVNSFWGHHFVDENNGVLLGGTCGFQLFYKTTNGGQSWTVSSSNVSNSKLSDALILEPNGLGYAVGSGTFWRTINGGSNWDFVAETGSRDWHEDIAISGSTILLPISPECDGTYSQNSGGMAYSNDLGRSWNRFNTGAPMYGTYLLDDKKGWAMGFKRTIYYTNDGGKTWNLSNCGIPSEVNLDDVYFIDDTTGWAVGDGIYTFFVPDYPTPTIQADNLFICEGDSVTLSIEGKYDEIIWSNGSKGKSITVKQPGTYKATVYVDSICFVAQTDNIEINFYEKHDIDFSFDGKYPPCEGDTLTIIAGSKHRAYQWNDGTNGNILKVTKNGIYTVNVIDSNGCANYRDIEINFNKLPNPKIYNTFKDTFCIGDVATLYPDTDYEFYEWIDKNSGKVISNNREISVSESGNYYLKVVDSNGCEASSNIKSIFIRNETNALTYVLNNDDFHFIDSTSYRSQRCSPILIKNNSEKDFYIDDVYFAKNLSFSVPLSQFSLLVPARDSISLIVCFSPQELGELTDTITVRDICSDHHLPVQSFGILSSSSADSKCEVPLIFSPKEIAQSYSAVFDAPSPNPAKNQIAVNFDITRPEDENLNFDAFLSNILGDKFDKFEVVKTSIEHNNGNVRELGKILFNIKDLNTGYYLFLCNIQNNIVSFPVVIKR